MSTYSGRRPRVGNRKGWQEQQSVYWYEVARVLVALVFRFWVKYFRSAGAENIPSTGGVFLIVNHTTLMDPFILCLPIKQRMVRGPAKEYLFKNPAVGHAMRKIGMFPIRQESGDPAAVRTMVELYRKGGLVAVYPEGGRSDNGQLLPFFPDFARLMIKLKAPMIPVAVAGGNDLLPVGSLIPRPGTPVVIIYGDPFELSDFYDQKLTPELACGAAAVMHEKVAELLVVARSERGKIAEGR